MATDYEKFYQNNPHELSAPTKEFVTFFAKYEKSAAYVLDFATELDGNVSL